jgi:hypothetical protein
VAILHKKKMKTVVLSAILLSFLTYCSRETSNNLPQEPQTEEAAISVISGNNQAGQGNTQLADSIVVQVVDSTLNPIFNLDLNFNVVEGGGSIVNESTISTDTEGRASVEWIIGSSYNGIEVRLSSDSYNAAPCYIWAVGENPTGIHRTRTIASFEHIEDALYSITFYGNYSNDRINQSNTSPRSEDSIFSESGSYYCSLFSVFGDPDNYLLGRNFDNPTGWQCLTLLTRVNPNNGYASIAPVRMRDFGYEKGTDFDSLTFANKSQLLDAVFHPPDGINEHGLVVGLANVTQQPYIHDPDKETISCVLLVRKILDHAKTVDEAAEIAMQYNIEGSYIYPDTLDVHAIVADASGRSIILEPADGEMKIIPNTDLWQVLTNTPVFNVPLDILFIQCDRYMRIYNLLDHTNGILSSDESMDLLSELGWQWTEWSAVYDISHKSVTLAIDFNFDILYKFIFEDR